MRPDKRELRRKNKALLAALTDSWLEEANRQLVSNLESFLSDHAGSQVLCWHPFFHAEPDLLSLSARYRLYFPRIADGNQLKFFCNDRFVADGINGFMQPEADPVTELKADIRQQLICLLPGLAFDLKGNRLGRGAGMYDRFLESMRRQRPLIAVGVCWSLQILPEIDSETHDQPVDLLVTEKQVYKIK